MAWPSSLVVVEGGLASTSICGVGWSAPPRGRGRVRTGLTLTVAGLVVLVPVTFGGHAPGVAVLAWPGYAWLAIMFYLFVFLLVLEMPRAVAGVLVRRRAGSKEPASVVVAARAGGERAGFGCGRVRAGRTPDVPVDAASPVGRLRRAGVSGRSDAGRRARLRRAVT